MRNRCGAGLLSNLFELGREAVLGANRLITKNPRQIANFVTGLAGTAGLAYGAKKLHDHLKEKEAVEGGGLLGAPGYQRTPAWMMVNRPEVPTLLRIDRPIYRQSEAAPLLLSDKKPIIGHELKDFIR